MERPFCSSYCLRHFSFPQHKNSIRNFCFLLCIKYRRLQLPVLEGDRHGHNLSQNFRAYISRVPTEGCVRSQGQQMTRAHDLIHSLEDELSHLLMNSAERKGGEGGKRPEPHSELPLVCPVSLCQGLSAPPC